VCYLLAISGEAVLLPNYHPTEMPLNCLLPCGRGSLPPGVSPNVHLKDPERLAAGDTTSMSAKINAGYLNG